MGWCLVFLGFRRLVMLDPCPKTEAYSICPRSESCDATVAAAGGEGRTTHWKPSLRGLSNHRVETTFVGCDFGTTLACHWPTNHDVVQTISLDLGTGEAASQEWLEGAKILEREPSLAASKSEDIQISQHRIWPNTSLNSVGDPPDQT